MTTSWTLRARWILPADRPPIPNGLLTIADDLILAVTPAGERTPDVDLGDVAVLPGLVNAHTHLDLGELRGKLPPPTAFADWLRQVVAYRRASSPAQWKGAIASGVEECLRSGTTLVGDIAAGGLSAMSLLRGPLRSTVYYELIGLTRQRARQTLQEARAWLDRTARSNFCRPGLSPHAPYTVRRGLIRWACREGRRRGAPLAMHVGETTDELNLLATHAGPFRELLEDLGAWDEEGLAPNVSWILHELELAELATSIHGNYLEPSRRPLVCCPRTHAYFGHPPHPFKRCLKVGAMVALGTDSLASNPDLSLLAEMRYLHGRHPELPGSTLLSMATLFGARVLGWERETGSLTPGKMADLITVPCPGTEEDPYRLWLDSGHQVRDVWIGGRQVVRAGQITE